MFPAGKLIKAEKWWNDKAPPVMGLAYFLLAVGDAEVPPGRTVLVCAAFVAAFIGVAGFGHVVNDLGDIDHDRAAGKPNSMQRRTGVQRSLIVLLLLAAAWLPWIVLPASRWNLSLVGLQLLLLTIYAAPPLRLKARPIPGIVTDALYAYTVPALITWTTFGSLAGASRPRPWLLATLIPWTLCAGLRGILNHQYLDAETDARSGLTTFATRYGRARTLWLLSRIVLPAEAACFVALTIAFSLDIRWYPIGVGVFAAWRTFQLAYLWDAPPQRPWRLARERIVSLYGYDYLGEFYTGWFPIVMLVALSSRRPIDITLAILHLAFFKNGLVTLVREDLKYIPAGIAKMTRHLALR